MKEKIMKTFNNVKRVIITNKSLSLKILSAINCNNCNKVSIMF